jgi:hypothetical protein
MWYSAHVIMHLKPKVRTKGEQLVWENVLLIEAESPEIAVKKAEMIGLEDQAANSDGLTIDEKPVTMVFVGVRKLIECRTVGDIEDKPADGSEVTYSEFLLESEEDLRKLALGDPVKIMYRDGHGEGKR